MARLVGAPQRPAQPIEAGSQNNQIDDLTQGAERRCRVFAADVHAARSRERRYGPRRDREDGGVVDASGAALGPASQRDASLKSAPGYSSNSFENDALTTKPLL